MCIYMLTSISGQFATIKWIFSIISDIYFKTFIFFGCYILNLLYFITKAVKLNSGDQYDKGRYQFHNNIIIGRKMDHSHRSCVNNFTTIVSMWEKSFTYFSFSVNWFWIILSWYFDYTLIKKKILQFLKCT